MKMKFCKINNAGYLGQRRVYTIYIFYIYDSVVLFIIGKF